MRSTAPRAIALLLALLCLTLTTAPTARAELRHPLLDAGLSLLEEGNVFIERYNQVTGARVRARYPLGLPYFFGGRYESRFLKVFEAWQDSGFFRAGQNYIGGPDCYGLAEWMAGEARLPISPVLGQLTGKAYQHREHALDLDGLPYELLHRVLQTGDYLVLKHGYNHVMIYIGTLRDYGYDPEILPRALRPYIDHPLFLQSGVTHYHGAWYSRHIGDLGLRNVHTTDGGVSVAIWGVPADAAPYAERPQQSLCRFFRLDGTAIMVPDMWEYSVVRYYRYQ